MEKKKRKSPTEIIESVKNPELESVYIKFPGKNVIDVNFSRNPFGISFDRSKIIEHLEKHKKPYSMIHTHLNSYLLPSGEDLEKFLLDSDQKSMIIAQQNSKNGKIKGYFIVRKPKKKLLPFSKKALADMKLKVSTYDKKTDDSLYLGFPDETMKTMNSFMNEYNLKYKFVPADDYEFDKNMMNFRKKEKDNLESKTFAVITIAGLVVGMFFLSPAFTGNAIGSLNQTSSNWIGGVLFVVGLVGAFFCFRKRRV